MQRLNQKQKDKVKHFCSVADTSEKVAMDMLKSADWNMEARIDASTLEAVFNNYAADGSDPPMMLAEGVVRLCEDLSVDPSDVVLIVLSYHFKASEICQFSKEEFVGGMQRLGCESIAKLKDRLPSLRQSLGDDAFFREVYDFTFGWAKEKTHKSLALDSAVAMWQLLLMPRWPLTEQWLEFIQSQGQSESQGITGRQMPTKAVTKDTWSQVADFSRTIKADLSNYDPEGAWPTLIDDFVEVLQKKGAGSEPSSQNE